jgi:hypothetical protein
MTMPSRHSKSEEAVMAGDGGRVPDVSEQRWKIREMHLIFDLDDYNLWRKWAEGNRFAESAIAFRRLLEKAGLRQGDSRASALDADPASVLAALLAENPDATAAAIEALLTSDLRAVTMHPAWSRVDGRKWAGAPRSDMAEVVIEAACRSLLSKAPKEDGVSDEGGSQ